MYINKFPTIPKKKSNLMNCLEANQGIYWERYNHKNRHPHQNLPKTCGGRKSACLVWILSTDNLKAQPKKISGSINADPKNMLHTGKQPTKKGLNKYLEGYFRNPK